MADQPGEQPSNLNIANVLTVLRIAGVPVFGWLLLHDAGSDIAWRIWSWVAFVLLMLTDRIDGDLARRRNLVTNFGKLADPIADKALTGMAFIGVSIIGVLWWPVTVLVLLREWGITMMRFGMRKYSVMPASQGGKIKTALQAVALGGYLLPFELWSYWWADALRWATHITMGAAVAVTVGTGLVYVRDALAIRRSEI